MQKPFLLFDCLREAVVSLLSYLTHYFSKQIVDYALCRFIQFLLGFSMLLYVLQRWLYYAV